MTRAPESGFGPLPYLFSPKRPPHPPTASRISRLARTVPGLLLLLPVDASKRGIPAPEGLPSPAEIPFGLDQGKIILPVWVQGTNTLLIILDTDMPIDGIHVFRSDFADHLAREDVREVQVGAAGAKSPDGNTTGAPPRPSPVGCYCSHTGARQWHENASFPL